MENMLTRNEAVMKTLFPSANPNRYGDMEWARYWREGSSRGLSRLGMSTLGRHCCFGRRRIINRKIAPLSSYSSERDVRRKNSILEESVAMVMDDYDAHVLRKSNKKKKVILKFILISVVPSFLIMLVPVNVNARSPDDDHYTLVQWFFGVYLCMLWVRFTCNDAL